MDSRDRAWSAVRSRFSVDTPATRVKMQVGTSAAHDDGPRVPTVVAVTREDSIVASYPFSRPLVLVFADDVRPGGCVDAGAGMQEESIFRRTGIHRCLLPRLYPIAEDECLYCPDVPVVFDSEAAGYAPLDPEKSASFVACPGVKFPVLQQNQTRLTDGDAVQLARKVAMLVELAVAQMHDCLVLGALGCGAWGCPPRHVAEVMVAAIREHAVNRIPHVVFACPGSVHAAFADALSEDDVLA